MQTDGCDMSGGAVHLGGWQRHEASLLLQSVQQVPDEGVVPDKEDTGIDACTEKPTLPILSMTVPSS